jgi:hypothetical protein
MVAITAAVVLIFSGALLLRISHRTHAFGSKHGLVVDQDTGLGIPGVRVVIQGYYYAKGPWEDFHHCTYVQMATTDVNGYYNFPSQYARWNLLSPGADPSFYWYTYLSKAGFAPASMPWPIEFSQYGTPVGMDPWISDRNPINVRWFSVDVPPIRMKQIEPKVQDKIILSQAGRLGLTCNRDDDDADAMAAAARQWYKQTFARNQLARRLRCRSS